MPDHRVVIVFCGDKKGRQTLDGHCITLRTENRCPDPTCPGNDMEGGG